jgi:chromosome segregation ATPase
MTSEPALRSIEETLVLLEGESRAHREANEALGRELEQLRRQIQSVVEQNEEQGRATRKTETTLARHQGVPQKVTELSQDAEQLRTQLTETRSVLETAERTRDAEALVASRELREAVRRLDQLDDRLQLLASEAAGRESKLEQLGQSLSVLMDWQQEVRQETEQFELRLQRLTEVSEEVEGRVLAAAQTLQERPLEVIHERLQILGELAHRAEERLESLRGERELGEEVRAEMERRRDEQERIEAQVSRLEGAVDNLVRELDEARGETALLDGRHSGLSERVSLIRRDISEMVDHVREEFARFSEMQERSRKRQIDALEQELREMKFHALRPPDEP